jgi:hypothetical protein
MQSAALDMSAKYTQLKKDAESLIKEIASLPAHLNNDANSNANNILQYAAHRTSAVIDIDYDVKDRETRFTYSEMLSFIQLFNSNKTELEIIRSGLIRTAPPKSSSGTPAIPIPKIYSATIPGKKLKVTEYKAWLQQELQKLAGASDNDEIEIN